MNEEVFVKTNNKSILIDRIVGIWMKCLGSQKLEEPEPIAIVAANDQNYVRSAAEVPRFQIPVLWYGK